MSKIKRALDVVKDLRSLADSIEYLAEALEGNEVVSSNNAEASTSKEAPKTTQPAESTQPAETKESQVDTPPEVKEPEEKQPTLEEVRAAMAEKNREGHREKVKAIIHKYGANKLTALDPKHYAQVLKEVGEIK